MPKKISKNLVWLIALLMLGGMVGAYWLKYGAGEGVGAKQARIKATIAAQVGNDQPVSDADAKKQLQQADQTVMDALAKQKNQSQPEHVWPKTALPFQTGLIQAPDLDRYEQAKQALMQQLEKKDKQQDEGDSLPHTFEAQALTASQDDNRHDLPSNTGNDAGTPDGGRRSSIKPVADSATSDVIKQDATSGNNAVAVAQPDADPNLKMLTELIGRQTRALTDSNQSWQQEQAKTSAAGHLQILHPSQPPNVQLLQEGSVVPLVLLSALNNTLPGHVSARVTQDVYDAITGDALIIPAGSKLEGNYNQKTLFNQKRMMLAFNRLIFPDGASIMLGAWGGNDAQGRSGVAGDIDNHIWEQLGTGLLLAAVDWAVTPSMGSGNVVVNTQGSSGSFAVPAGQVVNQTAQNILSRYQSLKPELNIPAGTKLTMTVLQDISIQTEGNGNHE